MRNYFLDSSLGTFLPVAFRRLIYFDEGMLQPYVHFTVCTLALLRRPRYLRLLVGLFCNLVCGFQGTFTLAVSRIALREGK